MKAEKLICVTEDNHNKEYRMQQIDDTTWVATYGRVGASMTEVRYPMSQWDKKYKEKLRKGYSPVTRLVAIPTDDKPVDAFDKAFPVEAQEVLNFLQSCARSAVKQNYTIAASDVTELQVAEAQRLINSIAALLDDTINDTVLRTANKKLLELYRVIPRRMKSVSSHLANSKAALERIVAAEQDLLDTLSQQVSANATAKRDATTNTTTAAAFSMRRASQEEVDEIKKLTDLDVSKVKAIYAVQHFESYNRYINRGVSNEKLYFHGSRNENWMSILNSSLKIRPANAATTGAMYGHGIYGANKAKKSIGYTSLRGSYWASGSSSRAFLALFKFNCGRVWDVHRSEGGHRSWMTRLDEKTVKSKGYDSVFAEKGIDLRNDEAIVYNSDQVTIKYLIELRG